MTAPAAASGDRAAILIVEDDPRLAELLRIELEQAGHLPRTVGTGTEALLAVEETGFALVVLDLNLPDLDGIEVAERLRSRHELPILMLTARGDVESRVQGLYAGASDYLTKPFSLRELLARVHVQLRRRVRDDDALRLGALVLEPGHGRCLANGALLDLTGHELQVLELLLRHRGRVFSREDIEARLYGGELPASNTVEVFVSRLRRKLADAGVEPFIHTVRGVGYVVR